MADKVRWQFPGIRILTMKKNVGFGRGNNAVLKEKDLDSEYHLLINPDVTFEPDLLTRMLAYMDKNPNCVILTPRVFNEDGSEQFLPKHQPTIRYLMGGRLEKYGGRFAQWRRDYTMADAHYTRPIGVEFATGCFLLIRTAAFRRLGGFDERFFLYQEDTDLSRRARELGLIVYHPDMCVTHAWKRDNVRSWKGTLHHVVSTFKFFSKWGFAW